MVASTTLATVSSLASSIGVFGYIVGGFFAFIYFWSRANVANRQENDRVAGDLINNLTTKVKQLEDDMASHTEERNKEISLLTDQLSSQQKEIHMLQGQNEAYLKILSLRDPSTQKVFKEAPEIFKIARENHKVSTGNSLAIEGLTKTIARFIDTLQPVLMRMEESGKRQGARKSQARK